VVTFIGTGVYNWEIGLVFFRTIDPGSEDEGLLPPKMQACSQQLKGTSSNCFSDENERDLCWQGERRKCPEVVLFTIEDAFWFFNAANGDRSRLQSK